MTVLRGKQGSRALMKAVRGLVQTDVLVGYPSGEAPREDGSPLNNAAIAYIQEHGEPEHNLPARPFLEPGIRNAQERITAGLRRAAKAAIEGNAQGVAAGQQAAGSAAVNSIKEVIQDGIDPPLAPATLAARKRKGFRGETPLLRTGELRNGVQWVLGKG